jgi:hypothetical protein
MIECPYSKYCNNVVRRDSVHNYYTNFNLTGCQFYSLLYSEKNKQNKPELSCHCIYPVNDINNINNINNEKCGKPCGNCVGNICDDHMNDFKNLFNNSFRNIIPNVLILLCFEYFYNDQNVNTHGNELYYTFNTTSCIPFSHMSNHGDFASILTSYNNNENCGLLNIAGQKIEK